MITASDLENNGFVQIYDPLYETGEASKNFEFIKGEVIVGRDGEVNYFQILKEGDERETVSGINNLADLLAFCDKVNGKN